MKMSKKTVALVSVITGSVMLATGVFANYANSNGYAVLKSAVKQMVKLENYTMDLNMGVYVDGEELEASTRHTEYDRASNSEYYKTTSSYASSSNRPENLSERSIANGTLTTKDNYYIYNEDSGQYTTTLQGYVNDLNADYEAGGLFDYYGQEETAEKAITFMELAADMVVGDLKNNFVYVGETDKGAEYSITLDSFQIPEIVNAGMSLIGSSYKETANMMINGELAADSVYADPFYNVFNDMTVSGGSCRIVVDESGNLSEMEVRIDIVGRDADMNEHTMSIVGTETLTNIGTTAVQAVDLSDCDEIETETDNINERIAEIDEIIAETDDEDIIENYRLEQEALRNALNGVIEY